VWFVYSPDRRGEHPEQHLGKFRGTLQADAYAGFHQLYESGRIQEAACWAHVRRKFYDLQQAHASPVASEALERIAALYAVEKEIRGRPPDERRAVRQARAKPLLASLRKWFEATLPKLSRKSDTTAAIRYALSRWDALVRYADEGNIEIDNNAAERALRGVALGRKNYLFAGSDAGGERAASIYGLIGSAKLNGLDPEAYLRQVLARIADHPISHRGVATLEHRRQSTARRRTRSLDQKAIVKNSAIAPASLPNIAELITYGEITVGVLRPVGCVATATDGHNCLAMLVRRRGETLAQFLTRLDRAIDQALTEEIYTDEINAP
jgi:hypothetical protein